jgi:hypothetical protein
MKTIISPVADNGSRAYLWICCAVRLFGQGQSAWRYYGVMGCQMAWQCLGQHGALLI